MQLGACFAGLAIESSMLGATHALANPLTAQFGIVHGQAIGLMLPHVIRFNGEAFPQWYSELSDSLHGLNGFPSFEHSASGLASYVSSLVKLAELPQTLSSCGITRESLPKLAADAAQQWTGTFNPRQVDANELLRLYEHAF
jgi:alcohol dehydrogenase